MSFRKLVCVRSYGGKQRNVAGLSRLLRFHSCLLSFISRLISFRSGFVGEKGWPMADDASIHCSTHIHEALNTIYIQSIQIHFLSLWCNMHSAFPIYVYLDVYEMHFYVGDWHSPAMWPLRSHLIFKILPFFLQYFVLIPHTLDCLAFFSFPLYFAFG